MGKYFSLVILSLAIIWGGIKKDLFTNVWINISVSVVVLMLLWFLLELTQNKEGKK